MLQRAWLTLAILLVAGFGAAEALWRWGGMPELRRAPEQFAAIPNTIGPWVGTDQEIRERNLRQGEIKASLLRRYTNQETGDSLNVLLVAGRAGPIAVHSPEVCLGGSGFSLAAPATRAAIAVGDAEAVFWHGVFHKGESAIPEKVELYWSWNPGSGWRAASAPRWDFARERVLYKLYVSRPLLSASDREGEQSPIPGFLQHFLSEVQRAVFAGDETSPNRR